MSLKRLFLIRSEIFRLLVNTLTANYEYSRSNRHYLPLQIQIKLSKKLQTFGGIFFQFLKFSLNFQCCETNMSGICQIVLSYWLRNMCIFKCITRIVSGNPLAVNVLTSPRNSWNLQKSTFIQLFHPSEPNRIWKK